LLIRAGTAWDMPKLVGLGQILSERHFFYLIFYGLMILFFSYFWVATQFNELQIADDLKKYGGYIPSVRPGQATRFSAQRDEPDHLGRRSVPHRHRGDPDHSL